VPEKRIPKLIQATDLEKFVALLQARAEQTKATPGNDATFHIVQSARSNARALELALSRLMAHSSVNSTELTLACPEGVLKRFAEAQARKAGMNLLQVLPAQESRTTGGTARQHSTAADRDLAFCLLEAREAREPKRVRYQLEVNMRERERDGLARRDGYERALECRAKKLKQA
jgi:chromosomal replication initiation ATPase DnaA